MKTDAERVLADTCRQNAIKRLSQFLFEEGFFQNCNNCAYWSESKQICEIFKVRPPTSVIVAGCSEHSDNIPF